MALQNFADKVGPAVSAAWLNAVDVLKYTVFGDAATKAAARTALTQDAPWAVNQGGTGATTAAGARTALTTDAPMSIPQGGTGATTAAAARAALFEQTALAVADGGTGVITQAALAALAGGFGPKASATAAATVDLGAISGNPHFVELSGATTITSFGSSASTNSPVYLLKFVGAVGIQASASLAIFTMSSGSTYVGINDLFLALYTGSGNWTLYPLSLLNQVYSLSGSFTPTWTGFSSNPTGSISYTVHRTGLMNRALGTGVAKHSLVTLWFTGTTSTSNGTGMSITNLPADICPDPVAGDTIYTSVLGVVDSGTTQSSPAYISITSGGVMTFNKTAASGAWTNTGNKGFVNSKICIQYAISPDTSA